MSVEEAVQKVWDAADSRWPDGTIEYTPFKDALDELIREVKIEMPCYRKDQPKLRIWRRWTYDDCFELQRIERDHTTQGIKTPLCPSCKARAEKVKV